MRSPRRSSGPSGPGRPCPAFRRRAIVTETGRNAASEIGRGLLRTFDRQLTHGPKGSKLLVGRTDVLPRRALGREPGQLVVAEAPLGGHRGGDAPYVAALQQDGIQ